MSNPEVTVDVRFTTEGISMSMYGENNEVLDESWFTWAEVEEMKADDRSHTTFEYDPSDAHAATPRVTDIDRAIVKTGDIEVSADIYEVAWTKDWQESSDVEMLIDPEGMPGWMEELLEP